MKRTFKQTVTWKETGKELASRELEFDESSEMYHRPVFISGLMRREQQFLEELVEIKTEEIK